MTTVAELPEHPRGEWVLVTNDDGIDSPALRPLLRELTQIRPVVAVVPSREFSWTSKTLSRFATPRLQNQEEVDLGCPLFALDGSPADCANIGVHNLYANPPTVVVSGVNIGANAGLAFLLSSGTVGAAIEAMLAGVPAIALSAQLRAEDYAQWRGERTDGFLEPLWRDTAIVSREIVSGVLAGGLPKGAGVLSVNMPPQVDPSTPRRMTGVTPTTYGAFFRQRADGAFEHHYEGFRRVGPGEGPGDIEALESGEISMTPLKFDLSAPIDIVDRRRFERGV